MPGNGTCFTFVSDTQITVTHALRSCRRFNVKVTTPGGMTGNQTYTYVPRRRR